MVAGARVRRRGGGCRAAKWGGMDLLALYNWVAVPLLLVVGAFALVTGAPPMPSPGVTVEPILGSIPEGTRGRALELGSGWGQLALAMARRHPGLMVEGVELSPVPYFFSRAVALLSPLPNLLFKFGNFHNLDMADARVVVCYLSPANLGRLAPKLEASLPRGCLVVSNTFNVPGWKPNSELVEGGYPVYTYTMPPEKLPARRAKTN